jgi:hypothetical protein
MAVTQTRMSTVVTVLCGVVFGWCLASVRPSPLRASASGGDRLRESVVATGPVMIRFDEGVKSAVATDALYFLDYSGGRLLATIPTYRQTTKSLNLIDTFEERDLIADFGLDLDSPNPPHFLMTTGSLGAYTEGWAPLYVFETTTNRVGIYRLHTQQTVGKSARPRFELIELKSFARGSAPAQSR